MPQPDLIPVPLDLPPELRPIRTSELPSNRNRVLFVVGEIWRVLAPYLIKRASRSDDASASLARDLRQAIEKMGGLMIKVAQLLSLRVDLLPPEVCAELSVLQDRSQGFSFDHVRRVVEQELGMPIESAFTEFEERPFAAASISQVHRARIASVRGMVVVKVQRPDAQQNFGQDLRLIEFILYLLKKSGYKSYLNWDGMATEIREIVREELDYRYEAANIERMSPLLEGHGIYVPELIESHSRRRILTMEYVPGILMTDYIRASRKSPEYLETMLRINDIDPALVGKQLFESFFRQMLEDNLFHADLHPGNIMLLRDSRICLIDMGAVGSLDAHFLRYYRRSMQALGERDYDTALDYSLMLCDSLPATNLEEVKAELIQCYRQWDAKMGVRTLGYHEKSIGAVGVAAGAVLNRNRIASSWQLLRVFRSWGSMDAALGYLLPNADYLGLIEGYFQGASSRMAARSKEAGIGATLARVSDRLAEISDLAVASLRASATGRRVVPETGSPGAASVARKISWCVTVLAIWVFLHQHLTFVLGWLPPNQYSAWAHRAPMLAPEVWAGVFLLLSYILLKLNRR